MKGLSQENGNEWWLQGGLYVSQPTAQWRLPFNDISYRAGTKIYIRTVIRTPMQYVNKWLYTRISLIRAPSGPSPVRNSDTVRNLDHHTSACKTTSFWYRDIWIRIRASPCLYSNCTPEVSQNITWYQLCSRSQNQPCRIRVGYNIMFNMHVALIFIHCYGLPKSPLDFSQCKIIVKKKQWFLNLVRTALKSDKYLSVR